MKQRIKKHHLLNNQQKMLEKHYLKCSFCLNNYHAWWSKSTNQASRCASEVYLSKSRQFLIDSSYPSQHDTTRFIVIENTIFHTNHIWLFNHKNYKQLIKQHYSESIVICDHCIDKFLKDKKIIKDETFNYWAPLDGLRSAQLGELKDWIVIDEI